MAIRWKVVTIDRKSVGAEYLNRNFVLFYDKNTIVEAVSETIGIFCFKRKYQAENFMAGYDHPREYKIIRVETFNRAKIPKVVIKTYVHRFSLYAKDLSMMLGKTYLYSHWTVPKGTLCYPKIKVLD
jgi:hypothetical protein